MNVAVLHKVIKETKVNWRFIFEDPLNELKFIPGQLVQLLYLFQQALVLVHIDQ